MKRKFAISFRVRLNQASPEQFVAVQLAMEKMGYRSTINIINVSDMFTNDTFQNGTGIMGMVDSQSSHNTIVVLDNWNQDLILTLAAMREGEEFFKGELITLKDPANKSTPIYDPGMFYVVHNVDKTPDKKMPRIECYTKSGVLNGLYQDQWRKATLTEIFQHYQERGYVYHLTGEVERVPSIAPKLTQERAEESQKEWRRQISGYSIGALTSLDQKLWMNHYLGICAPYVKLWYKDVVDPTKPKRDGIAGIDTIKGPSTKIIGYKLLKDTPEFKAGTELVWSKKYKMYLQSESNNDEYVYGYTKDCVETQPEWFKPIHEKKVATKIGNAHISVDNEGKILLNSNCRKGTLELTYEDLCAIQVYFEHSRLPNQLGCEIMFETTELKLAGEYIITQNDCLFAIEAFAKLLSITG